MLSTRVVDFLEKSPSHPFIYYQILLIEPSGCIQMFPEIDLDVQNGPFSQRGVAYLEARAERGSIKYYKIKYIIYL